MSTTDRYEEDGDWSGLAAWRTKKGWVIENWSSVQGDITQARYLIPARLVNLEEPLDREDLCLLWEMCDQGKCLRKGFLVE